MILDFQSSKYDRQERLSIWDQKLIEESTILIVGIGGTGSEVAKNLALLGIGSLILVDADTIEFSNLNRQMLFREENVGQKKAETASNRLRELFNPDIKIVSYSDPIQNIPQKIFHESDIIAGCVDNFLARQFLNSMAIEQNKPFIDSATDGFLGQVQYIKLNETACLACDNPPPPEETRVMTEPCTLVGTPRIRDHCAWKSLYEFNERNNRGPDETSRRDITELTRLANNIAKKHGFGSFVEKELMQLIIFHVPSLITVNAVISGIQSQEIIKALFIEKFGIMKESEQKTLESMMKSNRFRIPSLSIYSSLSGTINTFKMVPDPNCLVCSQVSSPLNSIPVVKINSRLTFASILKIFGQKYKKEYIGFRGNYFISEDTKIGEILSNGDRITLKSLTDEEEVRVKIIFEK
ncbi:MAG: ThiF family adenylyltransferase [Candidatus Hodarchaeales archaeon]|jgi:molybdopterin/thiamine biosynthesis adenylyltransferase